jgi:ADP-ribosylglycohydrolase
LLKLKFLTTIGITRNMETCVVRLRIKGGVIVQDADFKCVRRLTQGGWNLPTSPYANPFVSKSYATGSAISDSMMAVRDFFTYWFDPKQEQLRHQAHQELPGKTLGCFCRDKKDDPNASIIPCHCDVITYDVNGILTPILQQIMKTYNLANQTVTMDIQTDLTPPLPDQTPITTLTATIPVVPANGTVYNTVAPVPTPPTLELEIDNSPPRPDVNRIMAMIAGHAMGDALGVPHEFRYQHDVYTGVLQHRAVLIQQFQGKKFLGVGQYSDDTEMALCIARTMIKDHTNPYYTGGIYNRDHIIEAYLAWGNSKQPMMGTNTRQLLKGGSKMANGEKLNSKKGMNGYNERYAQKFGMQASTVPLLTITPQGEAAQSNGAIMRAWPLACIWEMAPVVTDVWATNPSTVAIDTNQVYVTALRLALIGTSPAEIWQTVRVMGQTEPVQKCLNAVDTDEVWSLADTPASGDTPKIKSRAWCVNGLYAAMACLRAISQTGFDSTTYPSLINWVIAGHPGSDTDTIAAIAGALIGAIVGYETLTGDEVTRENLGKVLVPQWDPSDVPRPPEYMLNDIAQIAVGMASLTGDKPDRQELIRPQRMPFTKYQTKSERTGLTRPAEVAHSTVTLATSPRTGKYQSTPANYGIFQAGVIVVPPKPPAIPIITPVFNPTQYPKPPPMTGVVIVNGGHNRSVVPIPAFKGVIPTTAPVATVVTVRPPVVTAGPPVANVTPMGPPVITIGTSRPPTITIPSMGTARPPVITVKIQ